MSLSNPPEVGSSSARATVESASAGLPKASSARAMTQAASRRSLGETPLHGAVRHKCTDAIVQMLLDRGADPDVKSHDGVTPRQLATKLNVRRFLNLFAGKPAASKKGGRR